MGLKHLLIEAKNEITGLRARNEILDAQMGIVHVFAAALGLKRGEGGMAPDVAYALQKQIEELDETERRAPREAAPLPQQQRTPMKFSPHTGMPHPAPAVAHEWRDYHGSTAWLFNPWTGNARAPEDIGSDVLGVLIIPAGEPVVAG